jgi:hypothetical protein
MHIIAQTRILLADPFWCWWRGRLVATCPDITFSAVEHKVRTASEVLPVHRGIRMTLLEVNGRRHGDCNCGGGSYGGCRRTANHNTNPTKRRRHRVSTSSTWIDIQDRIAIGILMIPLAN